MDVNSLSPLTLAFVGDAVYEIFVREMLAEVNRPSSELHAASVRLVKASAQAAAYKIIEQYLTEKELSVYKRGRNAHVNSVPKNANIGEYHSATGLEALFGYLHLSGNDERAREFFGIIIKEFQEKL